MSAAVGAISATKGATFNSQMAEEELVNSDKKNMAASVEKPSQLLPKGDDGHSDEVDLDEEGDEVAALESEKDQLVLGPQFSLKEQLEKDKDDESLRKWKEQLLGSVDLSAVGETKEPEVRVLSLTIVCRGRPDLVLPIPLTHKPKSSLFTLKEGCQYRIKFTFSVSKNIVSGLKYTNTVWKTGVRVDNSKRMLGTFSPQEEPYIYETAEDTVPASIFARGWYCVRTKFLDDDGKCYLDMSYYFEIQKNWPKST
ncbi:rho GDP-dissociation inhibitor 1-like [Pyrus ussuriensis x Pyrus communis]|uniref:Rho GDP-dissociation inhibitor 1-like n=1 Tax=Pyrus ussuriensis x Pyrus communis TaxID=2448454 RepID=A0A5N5HIK2_9ROSA|nr:rho GDP-dissociation inhibitor 1-like [Pyrus ussuriensis x Pyrus communis]